MLDGGGVEPSGMTEGVDASSASVVAAPAAELTDVLPPGHPDAASVEAETPTADVQTGLRPETAEELISQADAHRRIAEQVLSPDRYQLWLDHQGRDNPRDGLEIKDIAERNGIKEDELRAEFKALQQVLRTVRLPEITLSKLPLIVKPGEQTTTNHAGAEYATAEEMAQRLGIKPEELGARLRAKVRSSQIPSTRGFVGTKGTTLYDVAAVMRIMGGQTAMSTVEAQAVAPAAAVAPAQAEQPAAVAQPTAEKERIGLTVLPGGQEEPQQELTEAA